MIIQYPELPEVVVRPGVRCESEGAVGSCLAQVDEVPVGITDTRCTRFPGEIGRGMNPDAAGARITMAFAGSSTGSTNHVG
jgi:hypothetical protein